MRLAVLIDGENVSHKLANQIFAHVARLGPASERVVYGDFNGQAKSWYSADARHALRMQHVAPAAKGKQTADIALTIDAMDMLRDGEVRRFCIISSDGDFVPLAGRIRRAGCEVYGFGEAKTALRCREAYTQFQVLDPEMTAGGRPAKCGDLETIRAVVEECPQRDGWTRLSDFGKRAKGKGLIPKAHGFAKWSKVLLATGQFIIENGNQRFRPRLLLKVAGGQ